MNKINQSTIIEVSSWIKETLDFFGVTTWLMFGPFICCYRDGNLDQEKDFDTSMFIKDYCNFQKALPTLKKRLFVKIRSFNQGTCPYMILWGYLKSKYKTKSNTLEPFHYIIHGEIFIWYPVDNYYVLPGLRLPNAIPKHFFQNFQKINFDNSDKVFVIPSNSEECLKYIYGNDWKIPISQKQVDQDVDNMLEGKKKCYSIYNPPQSVKDWVISVNKHKIDGKSYWGS